jgi:D-aminoacyl-tRNA deacylase
MVIQPLKTVIVCSVQDSAGTNIRERLLERYPFEESGSVFDSSPVYSLKPDIYLVTSRQFIIYVDEKLDEEFHAERSVFISRHYAESGIPSLTAHFTGNFGKADFGGQLGEIARFSPSLLKTYIQNLRANSKDIGSTYNITLEATHHGPTSLNSTLLFVELGSSERQWDDMQAASKISEALMTTLQNPKSFGKCAVCVGGTHYSEKFNNFLFDSEYALGPIVPKYALEFFTPEILEQILQKSDQPIKTALIDKKGLGKFKEAALGILDSAGLEKIFV